MQQGGNEVCGFAVLLREIGLFLLPLQGRTPEKRKERAIPHYGQFGGKAINLGGQKWRELPPRVPADEKGTGSHRDVSEQVL